MADTVVEVFLLYLHMWSDWLVVPDSKPILLALHLMAVALGGCWLAH